MYFINTILRNRWLYFIVSFLFLYGTKAQICSPDYFFNRYQGNNAVYTYKVISTSQNDIIAGGAALKVSGDFADATDGWITKLSPRGTVLWSKRYFIGGYNSGGFLTLENATDSTYFATGRFGKYIKNANGSLQELDAISLLVHIDKFGNIIWVKRITYVSDTRLSTITKLQDNSFLISGSVLNSQGTKLILLKTDLSGNVSWYKLMFVDSVQSGTAAVTQLSNGEIILSGLSFKSGTSNYSNQGYYVMRLDPANGSVSHSSAIYFDEAPSPQISGYDNIKKIIALPNDTLLLATSFSERSIYGVDPGTKEALLIKAGHNGQFYTATGYYNTQPGCLLSDIRYSNNQFNLLLDDGYKSFYVDLDRGGNIINQNGFGNVYSLLKGYSIIDGNPESRFVFGGRRQYPLLGLMKTETAASIPCIETASQMIKTDVSSLFTTGPIQLHYVNPSFPYAFEDIGRAISWSNYSFTTTVDCFASCCDNIGSDTTQTELCNATQYRLPDNSIVKESGLYYTQHTTVNNCDSIAYYNILFSTKPKVNLGEDTCFGNSATITLHTDSGYVSYNWMGTNSSSPRYTITSPGVYFVSVTNQCGTSQDAIEVYKECDFPVYIPSAFTPNNDGLNDQFGFPVLNKNKLVSMTIYNRNGEKVFYSTERTKRWNGKYKNLPQPAGIYAYIFFLKTLDGRPIFKKGTLVLIR